MIRRAFKSFFVLRNHSFAARRLRKTFTTVNEAQENLNKDKPSGYSTRQDQIFEDILDITPKQMSYGFLVVCPTPIGNLNDLSIRQYEVLLNVDIIACEDTRNVGKLFKLLRERQVGKKMADLFSRELTAVKDGSQLVEEEDEDDTKVFDGAFRKKDQPLTVEQTKEKAKSLNKKGDSLSFFADYKGESGNGDEETFVYGLDDDFIRFLRQKIAETRDKKGRGILVSYYQHNEELRIPRLIQAMRYGLKVALVCDAGTPTISDPGFKLVNAALKEGLMVEALPGPSSVMVALSACGYPADKFIFEGYLSKTGGLRLERLEQVKLVKATCVVFENAHRLLRTLLTIEKVFGEGQLIYIGFELSKVHERHIRGRVREVYERLNMPEHKDDLSVIKGEVTLIIAPYSEEFNSALIEERFETEKKKEKGEYEEIAESVPANVERLITVLSERLEASDQELTDILSEGLAIPRSKILRRIVEMKHGPNRKFRNFIRPNKK